jgi:dipeptidase E
LPPEPTILAMGGGGFSMEPENPALDDFALSLCAARIPRVCLLPTASGDAAAQIQQFYATFGDRLCEPSHVALFRLGREPLPLAQTLLSQDLIYVGGGSMVPLLAVWRALGLDAILRACWERGIVLAGLSAGAMCWFEWGISTSAGAPAPAPGLALLPGTLSVHADGEPARLPMLRAAIAAAELPPGWAADDGVGLVFRGTRLTDVVTSRSGRRALRIDAGGETAVTPRPLPRVRQAAAPAAVAEFRRVRAMRGR